MTIFFVMPLIQGLNFKPRITHKSGNKADNIIDLLG